MQGGNQGPAGRFPSGVNRDRFSLLTAVLQKHAKLRLYTVDIHTNVVGGLAVKEPATDLAVAVAIASSYYEQPVPPTIAVIGEIGEHVVKISAAGSAFLSMSWAHSQSKTINQLKS